MIADIISWIGIIISVSTSVVRAANIGYLYQTYILSSMSSILLGYHAYTLGSRQLVILNCFHLLIGLMGIYRWTKQKPL